MSKNTQRLSAFGAGLLFGVGLLVSGMTDTGNTIGFLDVAGAWNPKLAGVMVGAIAVHALFLRIGRRSTSAPNPSSAKVDARLLLGAVLFGVGWGLVGYCPGPAIVSLGSNTLAVLPFFATLLIGMKAADLWKA